MTCSNTDCINRIRCDKYDGCILFGNDWDIRFICNSIGNRIFFQNKTQHSAPSLEEALAFLSSKDIPLEGQIKIAKLKKELICQCKT